MIKKDCFSSPWFQSAAADRDIVVRLFSERCGSANVELWLAAVYAYKGPLLVSAKTTRSVRRRDVSSLSVKVLKYLILNVL